MQRLPNSKAPVLNRAFQEACKVPPLPSPITWLQSSSPGDRLAQKRQLMLK